MALQTKTATAKCNGTDGANYTLTLTVTENSIDTANNRSNVTVKLTRTRANSSHYNHGYNNPTTITINGSTWATATPVSAHNTQATQTLIEYTDNITHSNDDPFTINVTGSFTSSSGTLSGGSVSLSMDLTTIPRETPCPRIDAYVGDTISFVINPASSSFSHVLKYVDSYDDGREITLATLSAGQTTASITLPSSVANIARIWNGDERYGQTTLLLYAYSGSTEIGYSTNNLIARVHASEAKTKINSVTFYDNNEETYALTNDRSKIVNFMSNVTATIDYTLALGTTLKEIIVSCPSSDGNEQWLLARVTSGNTITFSVPLLDYAFNVFYKIENFRIDLFDSFDTLTTYTYDSSSSSFVPYSPIFDITSQLHDMVRLSRPNQTSHIVNMEFLYEFWGGIFPNNTQNDVTIKWRVKTVTSDWSSWQTLVKDTDYIEINKGATEDYFPTRKIAGTFTYNQQEESYEGAPVELTIPSELGEEWDYLKTYYFQIQVTDAFTSNPVTTDLTLVSSIPIYDVFKSSGNGDKYFNINGNLIFNNDTNTNVKENIDTLNQNVTSLSGDISDIKSNNILWQDYAFMNANQVAYLSDTVLHQTNGIVLIFSAYSGGQPRNWNYGIQFVPKAFVTIHEGAGIQCTMGGTEKGVGNTKYVYIYNDRIEGNDANNNDGYVLREVIGV